MNSLVFDDSKAIPIIQEIVDRVSCRIVISTIESAKTACQISAENSLPLSSIYKKIKKLQTMNIVHIEKIDLDGNGKRVVYYRSRIKSLAFSLREGRIALQCEKNDAALRQPVQISLNPDLQNF